MLRHILELCFHCRCPVMPLHHHCTTTVLPLSRQCTGTLYRHCTTTVLPLQVGDAVDAVYRSRSGDPKQRLW